ncbi:MAG: hypothetical protein A2V66_03155 [Ignavibacteria bacterium RBG_13_36_8]|nr:MAG: hypothetical protein A2V66_03155 [Ignavibacteria bacterium RBG_13_36_8]
MNDGQRAVTTNTKGRYVSSVIPRLLLDRDWIDIFSWIFTCPCAIQLNISKIQKVIKKIFKISFISIPMIEFVLFQPLTINMTKKINCIKINLLDKRIL